MERSSDTATPNRTPLAIERRFRRAMGPLRRFLAAQVFTSSLLLVAAAVALFVANSSWNHEFEQFLHTPLGLTFGAERFELSLRHWVNDGLMALFFFLLGLEIKRELLAGELRDAARARLLLFSALGGMLAPAGLYWLLAPAEAVHGWGIPMATDTAFAIGVLALLGGRVSRGLVAFLVGLAIVDDIGAVLVIAAFYSQSLDLTALVGAFVVLAVLAACNLLGARRPWIYGVLGVVLWLFVLRSGIHATLAGVLIAMTVPARTHTPARDAERRAKRLLSRLRDRRRDGPDDALADEAQHEAAEELAQEARRATTPLRRWETKLETPIALLVLPIFALCNAGVVFEADSFGDLASDPLVLAIAAALLGGKFLGVTGACWVAVRLGAGRLPEGVGIGSIAGLSLLAGMGFTMSIFVANLAFQDGDELLSRAKTGILLGTLVAGVLGFLVLRFAGSSAPREP